MSEYDRMQIWSKRYVSPLLRWDERLYCIVDDRPIVARVVVDIALQQIKESKR